MMKQASYTNRRAPGQGARLGALALAGAGLLLLAGTAQAQGPQAARRSAAAPPTKVVLPNVHHEPQRWNNCGPTTILMALSAFGQRLKQPEVQAQLKPDREDTNVSPEELARFARARGLGAKVLVNGNRDIVRVLVLAGLPVIAEQWIAVHGRGEMGHYRVVIGFDDATGQFIAHDSYYGANRRYAYADFEKMWRPFLGTYVALWRPEQEQLVRALVGQDWDEATMWQRAHAAAEAAVAGGAADAWSFYNLGTTRGRTGDPAGAVAAFDQAAAIGLPFRAFWYQFDYFRALYETGQHERLLALTDKTLASMKGENLEESRYWRARALSALGRPDEARADLEKALFFNPLFEPARELLGP
jgi:tetratricopeptide (TPR) repeat protein